MSGLAAVLGESTSQNPLRLMFLRWQCRCRQIAMRENMGRPDDAITPEVWPEGADAPLGHIITVMNKSPLYAVTAELRHMAAKTHDPAQRREQALRFLSAGHYQSAAEFSDILCATFPPDSPGAARLHEARHVRLKFDAFAQSFDIAARVWRLAPHNPLHEATIAHNALFNPAIPPGTEVLGFEPDWDESRASAPGR